MRSDMVRKAIRAFASRMVLWTVRLIVVLVAGVGTLEAQSVLTRSPNIAGGWVGRSGQIHFNVVHRFDLIGSKIVNSPTILAAAGLGDRALFGVNYASNSVVAGTTANEWEGFVRVRFDHRLDGLPVDVAMQGSVNGNTSSYDGELTLARTAGRVRLLGVARGYTNAFNGDRARYALGGGASIALGPNTAIAGDVVTLLDRVANEEVAWSAALQLQLPNTPHSLSLHATNSPTTTLQGASLGRDKVRAGFEFTIPITLARFFGGGGASRGANAAVDVPMANGDSVVIEIGAFRFGDGPIRVRSGTTVVWRNTDPLEHSSTSDDGLWDSNLIAPGGSWSFRFDAPGDYSYHCTPHSFMTGRIVVIGD